ncbi:MAG: hypothetical protein JW723_02270 [Bacteroidales bacterium]|nr:hypothetical protein [Bacteroidales bacterium]
MSAGLIISIIIIAVSGYILFFPVTFKIDTDKNHYCLRLPGVFSLRVLKAETGWKMRYSIFLFRFSVPFFKPHKQLKKTDEKHPRTSAGFLKRRYGIDNLLFAINVIKAFRLRKLRLDIDTGDYPLNAQLIPAACYLSSDRVNLSVNFNDHNELYVILQSYLARIIYITIRHFMFNR